jgi:hypothetical protein
VAPGWAGLVVAAMPNVLHCCWEPDVVGETAYALFWFWSAFWGVVHTVLGRAVWMCQSVFPVLVLTVVFDTVARKSPTP